jgi:hypothetical protein
MSNSSRQVSGRVNQTTTTGIPGSRCGALHSSWPCGAAVRNRPGKPFRTDPATARHRRFNSAHRPTRNHARSAAGKSPHPAKRTTRRMQAPPQDSRRRHWPSNGRGGFGNVGARHQIDGSGAGPPEPPAPLDARRMTPAGPRPAAGRRCRKEDAPRETSPGRSDLVTRPSDRERRSSASGRGLGPRRPPPRAGRDAASPRSPRTHRMAQRTL